MSAQRLILNTVYSFNTIVPSILGARNTAVLLSEMSYDDVVEKGIPIDSLYSQVLPHLPLILRVDRRHTTYYKFKNKNTSAVSYLAKEWIDYDTITSQSFLNLNIVISQASLSDISTIRNTLRTMGYQVEGITY